MSRTFTRKWLQLVAASLFVLALQPAAAVTEYELKAALLYKLVKFVKWPDSAFKASGAPLSLCVVGQDPFGPAVDSLAGAMVHGHAIEVQRIGPKELVERGCHIAFWGPAEPAEIAVALRAIAEQPVLTVSDVADFAPQGGVVGFVNRDNRIRFQVNKSAAQRHRLEIGAQLLELADVVESNPGKK